MVEAEGIFLSLGFTQSRHEPSLFVKYDESGGIECIASTEVDDLLLGFAKTPAADRLREQISSILNIGKWGKAPQGITHTGREVKQEPNGDVRVTMRSYLGRVHPARISRARRATPDPPVRG